MLGDLMTHWSTQLSTTLELHLLLLLPHPTGLEPRYGLVVRRRPVVAITTSAGVALQWIVDDRAAAGSADLLQPDRFAMDLAHRDVRL